MLSSCNVEELLPAPADLRDHAADDAHCVTAAYLFSVLFAEVPSWSVPRVYIYIYISRWTRRPLPPHPKLLFCTRLCDCASVCLETMCSCPSFNVTSQEHELAAVDLGVLGSTQRCVDASCLTWVSFINISGSVWELGVGPCGAFEMGMEPDHFGAFPPESVHDENLDFNMDTLHNNPSPATAAEATVHALDFMAWLVHLVHM